MTSVTTLLADREVSIARSRRWTALATATPASRPPAPVPAAVSPEPAADAAAPARTFTVLLADDEPIIRSLGRKVLERCGWRVLLAEDGLEAVELYGREPEAIDLVILDRTMPRLSGDDAFRRLVVLNPAVRVLFSSGYSAEQPLGDVPQVVGFIGKPYRPDDLVALVAQLLQPTPPAAAQDGSLA